MFDDDRLAHFKGRLLLQQQELRDLKAIGQDAAKIVQLDQTSVGRLSRMDAMQGQAMSKESERRRERELQQISGALRRIEGGEYGCCVRCEEEIALPRLELNPAVTLCIACASQSEENAP